MNTQVNTNETIQDILLKQLRILSDESQKSLNIGDIAKAAEAMVAITAVLAELG